jgi:hypothetical protein
MAPVVRHNKRCAFQQASLREFRQLWLLDLTGTAFTGYIFKELRLWEMIATGAIFRQYGATISLPIQCKASLFMQKTLMPILEPKSLLFAVTSSTTSYLAI